MRREEPSHYRYPALSLQVLRVLIKCILPSSLSVVEHRYPLPYFLDNPRLPYLGI